MSNPVSFYDPSGNFFEYLSINIQNGTRDIYLLSALGITVAVWLVWTIWQYTDVDFVAMAEALGVEVMRLAEKLKTTDGETKRVRPLNNKEVREKGLHQPKQDDRYRGDDIIWITEDGDLYIGPKGGPIEPFN